MLPVAQPAFHACISSGRHQALHQELAFASYLNAQCAILPTPNNRTQIGSYARAINACLNAIPYMEFSVRIPIYDTATVMQVPSRSPSPAPETPPKSRFSVASTIDLGGGSPPEANMTTWEMWDTIRTICGYNPRLTLSQCAASTRHECYGLTRLQQPSTLPLHYRCPLPF